MVSAKKNYPSIRPRVPLTGNRLSSELRSKSPLLLMRLKELDQEFHRQTRQLAKLTKDFKQKISDKL